MYGTCKSTVTVACFEMLRISFIKGFREALPRKSFQKKLWFVLFLVALFFLPKGYCHCSFNGVYVIL